MLAGTSCRSNPAELAVEGDERIRTAVPSLSTDSAYERHSGFATAYALAYLLCAAASFGPAVLAVLVCVLLPLVAVVAWRRA